MAAAKEQFTCSHDGCRAILPGSYKNSEIPPGWTVGRIEEHHTTTVSLYYIYLCPLHKLASTKRQLTLSFTTPGAHS
jgi:hypothetical protein